MIPTLRFCASQELLTILKQPAGFTSGTSESLSVSDVKSALDRELAAGASLEQATGDLHVLFVGRGFSAEDQSALTSMVDELNRQYEARPAAACFVDAVILLERLFSDSTASSASAKFIKDVNDQLERLKRIAGCRLWLVDGISEKGQLFGIDDVRTVLTDFLEGGYSEAAPTQAGNLLTFGSRLVVFPRERVLRFLADNYALSVLQSERCLNSETKVAYAAVAKDCADFVQAQVEPSLPLLDRNEAGDSVIPALSMPAVDVVMPLSTTIQRLQEPIEDAYKQNFETVQSVVQTNRDRVKKQLCEQLETEVRRQLDESPSRTVSADAFLGMLLGAQDLPITGEYMETGRARTIKTAFRQADEFFDSQTGFDTAKRDAYSARSAELTRQREWVATLESELAQLEQVDPDSALSDKSADLATMKTRLEEARQELDQLETQVDDLRNQVLNQDLLLERPMSQTELPAAAYSRMVSEASAQAEVMSKHKQAAEAAIAQRENLEEEMRGYLFGLVLKLGGLLLGLILIWVVGLFALPAIFGSIPVVGAPLFGFIGTAVAAGFTKVWLVVFLVSLVSAAVALFSKYMDLSAKLRELTAQAEAAKAAFVQAARDYWNIYLRRLTEPCDFVKYFGAFVLERTLVSRARELRAELAELNGSLNAFTESVRSRIQDFSLESTPVEFVVVDEDYARSLLQDNAEAASALASKFFRTHSFSNLLAFKSAEELQSGLSEQMEQECRDDLFVRIRDVDVITLMKERGITIGDVAMSVQTLLSVQPAAFQRTSPLPPGRLLMVAGSDADFLRAGTDEAPIILPSPAREKVAIVRVIHSLAVDDVAALSAADSSAA